MFLRSNFALIFKTHSNANSTNFLSLSLHTKVINYVIWSRSLLTRFLLLNQKKVLQSYNIGTARIATHIRTRTKSIHTYLTNNTPQRLQYQWCAYAMLAIMNSTVCNLCDQKFPCGLKKKKYFFRSECIVFGCEI